MDSNSRHSDFHTLDRDKFVSRKEHLCHIVNMTESMLMSAKNKNWEDLVGAEAERQKHFDQFFSFPASPDEASWIKQGIERILDVDKQIIQIGEKNKQAILDQRNHLSKGRDATRAYSQS